MCFCWAVRRFSLASSSMRVARSWPFLTDWPSRTRTSLMTPLMSADTKVVYGSGSIHPEAWKRSEVVFEVCSVGGDGVLLESSPVRMVMTGAVLTETAGIRRLPKSRARTMRKPMMRATGRSQARERVGFFEKSGEPWLGFWDVRSSSDMVENL